MGLCRRCYHRDPDLPHRVAAHLHGRLEAPPKWLADFAAYTAARYCPALAEKLIRSLGQILTAGASSPTQLIERARRSDEAIGSLALVLEGFFVEARLAMAIDHAARRATHRRARVIEGVPPSFRATVVAYCDAQLRGRERALRVGTRPLAYTTIERRLSILRDLARSLVETRPQISRWELVGTDDVEGFLVLHPASMARMLATLRQFFGWARAKRLLLVDPTRELRVSARGGYRGRLLDRHEQRMLYRRWTASHVHPQEAFVGLAALLHGASNGELRHLRIDDVDEQLRVVRFGRRPYPLPLDPVTWAALERCLRHREVLGAFNPHVIVNNVTARRNATVSNTYFCQLLKPASITAGVLRSTRLAGLVISLDPKLVSEAFGLSDETLLHYLADSTDEVRLTKMANTAAMQGRRSQQ